MTPFHTSTLRALVLAAARLFALGSSAASVQALTIAQPNYGAAGLPLIAAVFNPSHTIYVALTLACSSVLVSPLTLAILEANRSALGDRQGLELTIRAVGRSLLKPIVLSPMIDVVLAFLAVPVPQFVGNTFTLIGQAAGGVALFLTGLILSSQRLRFSQSVLSGTLLKNVVHPLSVTGLLMLLPMPHDVGRAAILLAALPSGFFGVLFGLRYGVESQEVGSTLIASSVLSCGTLGVVLALT